jgi:hypothetical protein
MLSDQAKALLSMIQAAYDAGELIAPLEAGVGQLLARVAVLKKRLYMNPLQQQQTTLPRRTEAQNQV